MRRASRIDDTQREIVDALRKAGATVTPLHHVGGGVPDLLVGYVGHTLLIECKGSAMQKKYRGTGGLLPEQEAWFEQWRGDPPHICGSAEDAIAALRKYH